MLTRKKESFLRTKVKRLTSIVKHEGVYKLIEEDNISTPIPDKCQRYFHWRFTHCLRVGVNEGCIY